MVELNQLLTLMLSTKSKSKERTVASLVSTDFQNKRNFFTHKQNRERERERSGMIDTKV